MSFFRYLFNILCFWKYKWGESNGVLACCLSNILNTSRGAVFLFENARSGEYVFLKSLFLSENSKVALQAFTCNAVVNPILWLDLEPLYIDIDSKTLNISLDLLYEKLDSQTKVVVIQHTFGVPAFKTRKDFEAFVEQMHSRDIIVIEDCAHCLGIELGGKNLGTFGDASIFSFGIEKTLSTRVGGALIVNNSKYLSKIEECYDNLEPVGYQGSFLWLLNPLLWRIIRFFKGSDKLARCFRNFGVLNMGFFNNELFGKKPRHYPRKLSNVLSDIVNEELINLDGNLDHRKSISEVYEQNLSNLQNLHFVEPSCAEQISFLRYPIACETSDIARELYKFLKNKDIYIGDWYNPVIYPRSTSLESMNYYEGVCPNAEDIASRIINLPTGGAISVEYAQDICDYIICFFENYGDKDN